MCLVLPKETTQRSRHGVGGKPISCKPGVEGSILSFFQSVGRDFKPWPRLLRCFKTTTTASEPSGAPGHKIHKTINHPACTGYSQGTRPRIKKQHNDSGKSRASDSNL